MSKAKAKRTHTYPAVCGEGGRVDRFKKIILKDVIINISVKIPQSSKSEFWIMQDICLCKCKI